jgi:hypothetical protein
MKEEEEEEGIEGEIGKDSRPPFRLRPCSGPAMGRPRNYTNISLSPLLLPTPPF